MSRGGVVYSDGYYILQINDNHGHLCKTERDTYDAKGEIAKCSIFNYRGQHVLLITSKNFPFWLRICCDDLLHRIFRGHSM